MKVLKFLHYQRYLGLSDLAYSKHQQRYTIRATCCSHVLQLFVAAIFVSAFVAALGESFYYIETESLTGNIYDHAVILTVSITQLLANLWFRVHQQAQVNLLWQLSKLMRKLQVDTLDLWQPRWLYRVWLALCLWYAFMIGTFGAHLWLSGMQLSHILTLLAFGLRLLCANFQFTLYSSMVCVLQRFLSVQAELLRVTLLETSTISLDAIAQSLRLHDEILMLSESDFVQVYGGVLLFLFLYQVMECVLIFYVSTLEGFRSVEEMTRIFCWITPMLIYLILPLMINDVSSQNPAPVQLCVYYRICRYLGIFCIDYNISKERYRLRRSLFCYVVHLAVQAYLIACIAIMVLYWNYAFRDEMTKTGNHFDRLVMLLALGMLLVQNAWLIWLQAPHLRIVRQLEFYRRKHLQRVQFRLPQRLLWIIIISNMLYLYNFVKICLFEWLSDATRMFVITALGFPIRYLVTSFTMGTYCCMVHLLRHLLLANQSQISLIVTQLKEPKLSATNLLRLRGCLDMHDRLVLLCNVEISLVYGFIAWLSWMFASLDVTGVIYLAMVMPSIRSTFVRIVGYLVWLTPTLMTCGASFMSNRVALQANKTAKILAKVPRTGTGLDRMIEKFLLKNLRQQPILTAYGFFALDKSTLFKLFTAIFTYMVILVQFKEMENSTKSINKF
ncbi:blast:Gustatory and pheromone receptor 39a%2C isoform C [Drosophila guanche]|uniref:Gustatory receptor n=1 Tax=Drosophila guanche TaxID=7266 RepID=A0A3B0JV76_DROGU|nr:blast:Gustatory and pheromone receptor 39a%2C isoform C [Drosophila guanche]